MITIQIIMMVLSLTLIIGLLSTEGGTDLNKTWLQTFRYFTITIFSSFLIVYVGTLLWLTLRLKLYFPNFYQKEKVKIFVTNGCIIIAIIARISNNFFLALFKNEIDISYDEGTWFYPMYIL